MSRISFAVFALLLLAPGAAYACSVYTPPYVMVSSAVILASAIAGFAVLARLKAKKLDAADIRRKTFPYDAVMGFAALVLLPRHLDKLFMHTGMYLHYQANPIRSTQGVFAGGCFDPARLPGEIALDAALALFCLAVALYAFLRHGLVQPFFRGKRLPVAVVILAAGFWTWCWFVVSRAMETD